MKVLDLRCAQGHVFEGWFASEDDYQSQTQRQLIACPMCADKTVTRMLSAPRLNLSNLREDRKAPREQGAAREREAARAEDPGKDPSGPPSTGGEGGAPNKPSAQPAATTLPAVPPGDPNTSLTPQHMQAIWMQAVQHVLSRTEDVGTQFAEEARRIHYGEAQERGIRGQATADEREALADEGIEIASIVLPEALKGPLQ